MPVLAGDVKARVVAFTLMLAVKLRIHVLLAILEASCLIILICFVDLLCKGISVVIALLGLISSPASLSSADPSGTAIKISVHQEVHYLLQATHRRQTLLSVALQGLHSAPGQALPQSTPH